MRVLVTGAYGLIGSAVLARLHRDGHELIAAGRSIGDAARRMPFARWIEADFTKPTKASDWAPLLNGVDAVVNCVGVLEQGGRDDIQRTHVEGTVALFDACARAGVRRVIHISAIGASAEGRTDFARTKAQADAHLATLDLDWMIPRPALVLAPAAYGGTAMLRALAAFPLFAPGISGADRIQVVDVDDVTETVALCLKPGAPAKTIWEVAHPHVHALGGIVAALRGWLGFPPRPAVTVPRWMMVLVSFFATLAGLLGWRSPARPTALAQLIAGVVGDPARWMQATGIKPKDLPEILAQRPAGVQELVRAAVSAQAGGDPGAGRILDRDRVGCAGAGPRLRYGAACSNGFSRAGRRTDGAARCFVRHHAWRVAAGAEVCASRADRDAGGDAVLSADRHMARASALA